MVNRFFSFSSFIYNIYDTGVRRHPEARWNTRNAHAGSTAGATRARVARPRSRVQARPFASAAVAAVALNVLLEP